MSLPPPHAPAAPVDPSLRRRQRLDRELAAAGRHGLLPIPGALLLDAADFATFGPIGLLGGAILGGSLALLVARRHGLSGIGCLGAAGLGALYCTLPFTELLPLATALALLSQLLERASQAPPSPMPAVEAGMAARPMGGPGLGRSGR